MGEVLRKVTELRNLFEMLLQRILKYTINNLQQDLEEMEHEQYLDLDVEQIQEPNFEAI